MAEDELNPPGVARFERARGWPGPHPPAGTAARLTDRVLVHAVPGNAERLLDLVGTGSGLVLGHSRSAMAVARRLREGGFDEVVLLDPEGYRSTRPATAADPFELPEDTLGLFDELAAELASQRAAGATMALSPTRYLVAADTTPLEAAAARLAALDRDDVLLSVPIDYGWLRPGPLEALLEALNRTSLPKALFLGRQFAAATTDAEVAAIRRLVAEGGDVALLRTDLFGLDALAWGAFATSIGASSTLRHVLPPGQPAYTGRDRDESPAVLFPDLMSWFPGGELHLRFAGVGAPACGCRACGGRRLDSFVGRADQLDAQRHGVAVWRDWLDQLRAQPSLHDRARWWRGRCAHALVLFDLVNLRIQQPHAFEARHPLLGWARLDPPAVPAPRRPR